MVTEPASVLQEIAGILDRLGIPYAVGGSLASGHHGEIRATNDVDVLVEIDVRGARRLVEALGSAWHVDTAAVESAVARGSSFSAIHLDRMLKVDFFVATDARLDRLQLARRVAVSLGEAAEARVWFTSPEDVVLRKLEWVPSERRGPGASAPGRGGGAQGPADRARPRLPAAGRRGARAPRPAGCVAAGRRALSRRVPGRTGCWTGLRPLPLPRRYPLPRLYPLP